MQSRRSAQNECPLLSHPVGFLLEDQHALLHALEEEGLFIEFIGSVLRVHGSVATRNAERLQRRAYEERFLLLLATEGRCPECYRTITFKANYWQCPTNILHFSIRNNPCR